LNDDPVYPMVEFGLTVGTWDTVAFGHLDTGFDGGLIIPIGVGRDILSRSYWTLLELPDGTRVTTRAWYGTVTLEDRSFRAEIAELGSRYLIGREVLDRLSVCFEFGQRVKLTFRD
jgi:predicted aspartyl protease